MNSTATSSRAIGFTSDPLGGSRGIREGGGSTAQPSRGIEDQIIPYEVAESETRVMRASMQKRVPEHFGKHCASLCSFSGLHGSIRVKIMYNRAVDCQADL